ncbi:MAG: DUF2156 domain-containing protein [Anaerolineae bacterium]
MTAYPTFPHFKPLAMEDRDALHERLWAYQPTTSELTFTNLFIWRDAYRVQWSLLDDVLLLLAEGDDEEFYGFPPVATAPRLDATRTFLRWLREEQGVAEPRIERADERLVQELAEADDIVSEPTRDHFDYVYLREDLAELSGRDYSSKRNHLNYFLRMYEYTYEPLAQDNIAACVEVACEWCEKYRCEDDMNLLEERDAVLSSLENFPLLRAQGGVIRVEGKIQAFSVGEMMNAETLVVHIEKADPDIRGLYQLINREFVRHCCQEAVYVNREQDLGVPGLRRAKQSYHPHHMEKKYRLRLV